MKTLDLINLELKELETHEYQNVSGGFAFLAVLAGIALAHTYSQLMSNPGGVLNGFLDAFN